MRASSSAIVLGTFSDDRAPGHSDRTGRPHRIEAVQARADQPDGEPAAGVGRRRRLRWWRRSAGVAVAVAVMVLGSTGTAGATPRRPSPGEIATAAAGTIDGPVHGEFPVVDADGGVQTQRWQWGEVVAVNSASSADAPFSSTITVASEDGYASDYRVEPDQAAGVSVGDVVTVVGLVDRS